MIKNIFRACVFSAALLIGSMASAYHADLTSAVNLGMVKSYSRSAINVIDDDGAVYTFVYDNRPDSDWGFWKQEDDDHWHQWAFGVQQPSHMEVLASCGFYVLKDLGKL